MAAGAVPIVVAKGGLPEIIEQGKNGILWQNEKDLIKQSLNLINSPAKMSTLALAAQKKSRQFSQEVFCRKIKELIRD
jgi:glycosyltransferase involved in cell wall biosynthesis